MHELIDPDDPRCLYCTSHVDIHLTSQWIFNTRVRADEEKLQCLQCNESFIIHSTQNNDGVTEYIGFTFTCNNYRIFFNYIESYFDISDNEKFIVAIPVFVVDFADKSKLHEKIKKYIVFS